MNGAAGALKILRFNWPWYAIAGTATVAGVVLLRSGAAHGAWFAATAAAIVVADFWLLASLAASHYVYDRSPVARGEWLRDVPAGAVRRAAVFHAGHDEASAAAARALPHAEIRAFDFFDPQTCGTPSLARARAAAVGRDAAPLADRVPADDGAFDLSLVVFSAHEIRDDAARAAFFREVARVTAPAGRAIVVEHLRDGWNFAVYGPGAFHFLSRRTWLRTFAEGNLRIVREEPCTRFVRTFALERSA